MDGEKIAKGTGIEYGQLWTKDGHKSSGARKEEELVNLGPQPSCFKIRKSIRQSLYHIWYPASREKQFLKQPIIYHITACKSYLSPYLS